MKKKSNGFYVLGVGANTIVYLELLQSLNHSILGLYHFEEGREGEEVLGIPILGSNRDLFMNEDLSDYSFALSMGDNEIRTSLANQIRQRGGSLPTLISPEASVSDHAQIEEGVVIYPGVIIQPNTRISRDTVIALKAAVVHNATIEEGCWIAGNAYIGAYTYICKHAFVGISATILPKKGLVIGENAIIGGGSVVSKSVDANQTVVGNPARPL